MIAQEKALSVSCDCTPPCKGGHALVNVATVSSTMHMGSKQAEALPPLYEPQLIALGTNAMLLRGF